MRVEGEIIIRQGEQGDTFYLVESGIVEIYKDEYDIVLVSASLLYVPEHELSVLYLLYIFQPARTNLHRIDVVW
jgi:hypothetical protein